VIYNFGMRYVRAEDRPPNGEAPPGGQVDPAPMLGTWFATDKQSAGVVRLELTERGGAFIVRAFGAGTPEPVDWGEVPAVAYAKSVVCGEGMAVSAAYDFGFLESLLAAYTKGGILVLDTFNTFKDGSGRSAYFSREFFHR
jgi:hypothetical protein